MLTQPKKKKSSDASDSSASGFRPAPTSRIPDPGVGNEQGDRAGVPISLGHVVPWLFGRARVLYGRRSFVCLFVWLSMKQDRSPPGSL